MLSSIGFETLPIRPSSIFASAAHLPPELFSVILGYVGDDCLMGSSSMKKAAKKRVSACSLTCLYWAQLCRPHIFSTITLCSLQDIRDIQAFATSSCHFPRLTPMTMYIGRFVVEHRLGSRPWIHNVYALLRSLKMPMFNTSTKAEEISRLKWSIQLRIVDTHSPSGLGVPTAYSPLSVGLPRTLPTYFRRYDHFYLQNIGVTDFACVQRLIRDVCFVPYDNNIRIKNIIWTENTLSFRYYAPFLLRIPRHSAFIWAKKCTDTALLALTILSSISLIRHRSEVEWLTVGEADSLVVLDILRDLHDGITSAFSLPAAALIVEGCDPTITDAPHSGFGMCRAN